MPDALPYHLKVCNHFKEQSKIWEFFASAKTRKDQLNELKTELLKNTYKFDPAFNQAIYDKVQLAKSKLGLEQLDVYLYQAQYTSEMNASIIYVENEAHIIFSGGITQVLSEDELLAVLGHELSHIRLYTLLNGEIEVAGRIISAIANNYNSDPSYIETARLFQLYTEIFCDRGAYTVVGKTAPVITSLVKIATGLEKVSADSYLKQADEIVTLGKDIKAGTITHPENFIRARAIQLWHDKGEAAEQEIISMIEGTTDLDQLDIFKQKELVQSTKKFLHDLLKPEWFQTTAVLNLAKQFFPDFELQQDNELDEKFIQSIATGHPSIKDYFSYLLLDFALADASLELVAQGWTISFSELVQLNESFDAIMKKELNLSDKKLQQHKEKALEAYNGVKVVKSL